MCVGVSVSLNVYVYKPFKSTIIGAAIKLRAHTDFRINKPLTSPSAEQREVSKIVLN
jgi:hypothetical protein